MKICHFFVHSFLLIFEILLNTIEFFCISNSTWIYTTLKLKMYLTSLFVDTGRWRNKILTTYNKVTTHKRIRNQAFVVQTTVVFLAYEHWNLRHLTEKLPSTSVSSDESNTPSDGHYQRPTLSPRRKFVSYHSIINVMPKITSQIF